MNYQKLYENNKNNYDFVLSLAADEKTPKKILKQIYLNSIIHRKDILVQLAKNKNCTKFILNRLIKNHELIIKYLVTLHQNFDIENYEFTYVLAKFALEQEDCPYFILKKIYGFDILLNVSKHPNWKLKDFE